MAANFRQRYWRTAWDGVHAGDPDADDHVPAIPPWFTFHEGRHTHATWLTEDGIPEVTRRARLGQKMKGHRPDLRPRHRRARFTGRFPHLGPVITRFMIKNSDGNGDAIAISSPFDH